MECLRFVMILLAGFASITSQAGQAQMTLMPADEAVRRPDFFALRAQLQAAIARHDVAALLEVVDPKIKNSFGGDDGIEEFKRMWRINDSDSELWQELGAVLALGGTFEGEDRFMAPYTFSRWPDQADSFEHVAVIGTNVRIRTAPNPDAATINQASFSILKLAGESQQRDWRREQWTAIELEGGRKGYIATKFIRSPIDYRAGFTFSGGRWRLSLFVAGD